MSRRVQNDGVMQPRVVNRRGDKSTGLFTVPATMMREIPDGAWFQVEWTDEGILYRFLGVIEPPAHSDENVPTWVRDGAA